MANKAGIWLTDFNIKTLNLKTTDYGLDMCFLYRGADTCGEGCVVASPVQGYVRDTIILAST